MKTLRIALSIWLTGAAPLVWAQQGMQGPQEETPSMSVGKETVPAAGSNDGTRSTGRAGDSTTSGVSGPRDGATGHGETNAGGDTSGGYGSSGTSAAGGGAEDAGAQGGGSSSDNPSWQGIGSTGGATGTGESIGTADDDPNTGSARRQSDSMR